jgi:hypothetical protein
MSDSKEARLDMSEENVMDHGNEEFLATVAKGKAALVLSGVKAVQVDIFPEVDLGPPDELGLWN